MTGNKNNGAGLYTQPIGKVLFRQTRKYDWHGERFVGRVFLPSEKTNPDKHAKAKHTEAYPYKD